MTFTDDDLKRLKLFIDSDDNGNAIVAGDFIVEAKLKSLLARLEAAEAIVEYFANHPDCEDYSPYAKNSIEAWRKSKGEDYVS